MQEPASIPTRGPAFRFPWLNLFLFFATLFSTMLVGTLMGNSLFPRQIPALIAGFLFAATLLLILGVHELGHYFLARLHGVDVSLPYFIPVPFGLGTFGAFIRLRSPVQNRRALFDVGLAGPLAGLAVALPLFIVGLLLAPTQRHPSLYGDGLLMTGLIWLVEWLRGLPPGHHLMLHPVSFAAYIGLFITAVNLLPAGQLDGGHVAYALLRQRSLLLAILAVLFLSLLGLATGWTSWYLWAALILFFGLRHPPTLDDSQPLTHSRRALGLMAFLLLLLLFGANPFPLFR